jgi:hypothetical protein
VQPEGHALQLPDPSSENPSAQSEHSVEFTFVLVAQPLLHVHALFEEHTPLRQLQGDEVSAVTLETHKPDPVGPSSQLAQLLGHSGDKYIVSDT